MKHIISILIAVLFCCGFQVSNAQPVTGTIQGQIVDARTKQPIINANLVVEGTAFGTSTDLNGKYRIVGVEPGTYRLVISHVSYESYIRSEVIVNTARPTVINEELIPSAIQAEEVVVTSGVFTRQFNSTETSEVTLSNEEIRRYPGGFEDVVRTISTLPGVSVVNAQGRNDLLVRGGGPSENLYIVDNMVVPNINHFGNQGSSSGALSFINLDFIESVDFSTGGFGVKYGDKMSSTLSLNMRPGRTDRLGGRATMSATQFAIDVEGPTPMNGSFIFSARRSYLDWIFKANGLPFIPTYWDFNLFGNFEITPKTTLSLLGLSAIDWIERDQETLENRIENTNNLDNQQKRFIYGANLRHLIRNGYLDFTFNTNLTDFRLRQEDVNEVAYFRSEADEQEYSAKVGLTYSLNKRTKVSTGLGITTAAQTNTTSFADTVLNRSGQRVPREELQLPGYLETDAAANKYAAYAELNREFGRLGITLGVRGDYYDFINEKTYISPRLSANLRLSSRLRLKTAVGTYYQSPSYVWVLNPVNKDLKALRNDMAVVGGYYLLTELIQLSTEVYYKNYSDLPAGASAETNYLIITNTGTGYGGREDDFQSFGYQPLESTGKGIAYGLDLKLQKKYSQDCCYWQASLSLGKSEYTAPNGEVYPGPYDQNVVLNLVGGYKPNPRWEYSGKFRFWTGAPYTPIYNPETNNGNLQNLPEEYLSERLESGHHLDLRVDRRFDFSGWAMIMFLDVQNVYANELPNQPRWDFVEEKEEEQSGVTILPSIGIRAEF